MELVKTVGGEVKFLDINFLSQCELDFETLGKRKPFKVKIVDDLLNLTNEKYGLDFNELDMSQAVCFTKNCVVMVFEKNQDYLKKDMEEKESC